MSAKPKITSGYIYTPSPWREQRYTAYEQRDYSDGLRALLMRHGASGWDKVIVWYAPKGTSAGMVERDLDSNADIAVAVREMRARLKKSGEPDE